MSYSYTANITIPNSTAVTGLTWAGASATNAVWTNPTPRVVITDGDIVLDGISLRDTLKSMQKRLAIMVPHPELEREFEQLKELRNQYEALARDCEEKLKSWEILKKSNG